MQRLQLVAKGVLLLIQAAAFLFLQPDYKEKSRQQTRVLNIRVYSQTQKTVSASVGRFPLIALTPNCSTVLALTPQRHFRST